VGRPGTRLKRTGDANLVTDIYGVKSVINNMTMDESMVKNVWTGGSLTAGADSPGGTVPEQSKRRIQCCGLLL
jgi:hypothetical protein